MLCEYRPKPHTSPKAMIHKVALYYCECLGTFFSLSVSASVCYFQFIWEYYPHSYMRLKFHLTMVSYFDWWIGMQNVRH